MKRFLFLIITLFIFVFKINAQDIIFTKEGEKIKAKVEEVGIKTIKYKKFSNINGASYFILKKEILSIRYENGGTDDFSENFINLRSDTITYEGQIEIGNNYQVAYYEPTYNDAGIIYYKISKGYTIRN
jgi:hypothetical protein